MDAPTVSPAPALYPLAEAARLTRLDPRTAHRWTQAQAAPRRDDAKLTFPELLTLLPVRGFRAAGLGLGTIRHLAAMAAAAFAAPTPFVIRSFQARGHLLLRALRDAAPSRPEARAIAALSHPPAFAALLKAALFRDVTWQDDLPARWWPLGKDRTVVPDLHILSGAPHSAGTRVPISVSAAAVQAEGGSGAALAAVAAWYGVAADVVRDAVACAPAWQPQAA